MRAAKGLLLTCLAVAISLFAVSISPAAAAVWKDKGVNVTKFVEFSLSGYEMFEINGVGGMTCEVKATMTTEGGSTGKVTKFETKKCGGWDGMSKCELVTSESKNLPWTIDVNATDLTITNMRIRRTFKAGCPVSEFDKTISSLTVVLLNPSAITEVEYFSESVSSKTFGGLFVDAPNTGTYGIG